MAVTSSSSMTSFTLSKMLSFLSPSNKYPKTQLQIPQNKNPRTKNGGKMVITSMGTYNVQVVVEDNESEERLLNRFRREVMKAGVIQESKRRRFFENSQDKKKRKTREAAKRNRRRRPQARYVKQDNPESTKKKEVDDFDDDNWDLPEGDLPY